MGVEGPEFLFVPRLAAPPVCSPTDLTLEGSDLVYHEQVLHIRTAASVGFHAKEKQMGGPQEREAA